MSRLADPDTSISVIIPVHRGGSHFQSCLESIQTQSTSPKEWIVVIDGSSENTADLFIANKSGARVLTLPQQKGPGHARNIGATVASGDLLLFIDADVSIPPNLIQEIQDFHSQNPGVDAFFGAYDRSPSASNLVSQFRNLIHHYVHCTSSSTASTFWTGCGIVRRSVFLKMGGFCETLSGVEDVEFGYRLKEAGYTLRLCKHLQVKHHKSWNIVSMIKTDLFVRAIPWTRLLLHKPERFNNDLNLSYSHRLSVCISFLLPLSLIVSVRYPFSLFATFFLLCFFLSLNRSLYFFFLETKNALFVLQAVFLHGIFYFTGGMGFLIGTAQHIAHIFNPKQVKQYGF